MKHTSLKSTTAMLLACGLTLFAASVARANQTPEHKSEAMFKSMDTDANGQVSRAEHVAGARKMFTEMDADRDGTVTAVEMTTAHGQKVKSELPRQSALPAKGDKPLKSDLPANDDKSSVAMIKLHDQNADGRLTSAEHDAGCEKMFAKMDKNSDGWLSQAECTEGQKIAKTQ